MRRYDLSPLYRSTVGFDRLFSMIDGLANDGPSPTYPPYNIERTGENAYRITIAVAGFERDDLQVDLKDTELTVRGGKLSGSTDVDAPVEVLYQGIAARPFERRFQLADHVQIAGASLRNGLLHIDLAREVPEAKKPRRIPIAQDTQYSAQQSPQQGNITAIAA